MTLSCYVALESVCVYILLIEYSTSRLHQGGPQQTDNAIIRKTAPHIQYSC